MFQCKDVVPLLGQAFVSMRKEVFFFLQDSQVHVLPEVPKPGIRIWDMYAKSSGGMHRISFLELLELLFVQMTNNNNYTIS